MSSISIVDRYLEIVSVSDALNRHALGLFSLPGSGGDSVPGDPRVLQRVVEEFGYLRDVAWSVAQGLDVVVVSAAGGGFAGEVAEALRGVVSGRLKAFVVKVARAFSLAGEAVAGYRAVLVDARRQVAQGPGPVGRR